MAKARPIVQKIVLDGGKEIKQELEALGAAGERAWKQLQAEASKFKGPDGTAMARLRELGKQLQALGKQAQATGESIKDVGGSFSRWITLPVAGAGAGILKVAGDFESAMAELKVAAKATGDEFTALETKAREIGKNTSFGPKEAALALTELAKTGTDTTTILGGAADAVVKLAEVNSAELAPAAGLLSDVLKQFKLDASQAGAAVDIISGAVNESKLGFNDYKDAVAQAGMVAASSGVEFEDFNAALAATTSAFASGSDAGTSFKTFLQRLVPGSKEVKELMRQLGLSFYDASGQMDDMSVVAQKLQDTFAELSEEKRNDFMTQIFGTDGVRTAIALMEQGAVGIEKMRRQLRAFDTDAAQAAKMAGFNGQMKNLKGSLEDLAISIGKAGLLEWATNFVRGLAGLVDRLNEVNPALLKWGTILAGVAAAIGPVLLVVGQMVIGLGALAKGIGWLIGSRGFAGLGAAAGAAGATTAGAFVAMARQAGITRVAVAGIFRGLAAIAAPEIALIIAFWPEISAAAAGTMEFIKADFRSLRGAFYDAMSGDWSSAWDSWTQAAMAKLSFAKNLLMLFSPDAAAELKAAGFKTGEETGKAVNNGLKKGTTEIKNTLADTGKELEKAAARTVKIIAGGKATVQQIADVSKAGVVQIIRGSGSIEGKVQDYVKAQQKEAIERAKRLVELQARMGEFDEANTSSAKTTNKNLRETVSYADRMNEAIKNAWTAADVLSAEESAREKFKEEALRGTTVELVKLGQAGGQAASNIIRIGPSAGQAARQAQQAVNGVITSYTQLGGAIHEIQKSAETGQVLKQLVYEVGEAGEAAKKALGLIKPDPVAVQQGTQQALATVPLQAAQAAGQAKVELGKMVDPATIQQPVAAALSTVAPAAAKASQAAGAELAKAPQALTQALTQVNPFSPLQQQAGTAFEGINAQAQQLANSLSTTLGSNPIDWTPLVQGGQDALAALEGSAKATAEVMANAFMGLPVAMESIMQRIVSVVAEAASAMVAAMRRVEAAANAAAQAARSARSAAGSSGGDGLPRFASGGHVRGPGTGTSDSILSWLSDGEFVVRSSAVKRYGVGLLRAINSMRFNPRQLLKLAQGGLGQRFKQGMPAFASGGLVGRAAAAVSSAAPAAEALRPIALSILGQDMGTVLAPEPVAANLAKFARSQQLKRAGTSPGWKT